MKTSLFTIAAIAGMVVAEGPVMMPPEETSDHDSLRRMDSILVEDHRSAFDSILQEQRIKDSLLFAQLLPDSLRVRVEQRLREFDARRQEFAALSQDTSKSLLALAKADSLRRTWEAKRDSQVLMIKDSTTRTKVQARIVEITAQKESIRAKLTARRTELEARIREFRRRQQQH